MITGAPKIGVIAFKGMTPENIGNTLIRLHNRAMNEPIRIVQGRRDLWSEVPNINRAMCGTANPIKEMGPQ